jgi:hypothetical protein
MAEKENRIQGRNLLSAVKAWAQQRVVSLTVTCVLMAFFGQYILDHRGAAQSATAVAVVSVTAAALYWLAALLFVGVYGRQRMAAQPDELPAAQPRMAWFPLAGAVLLGVAAFPRFSGNRFSLDGTLIWLLGLALLALAAWTPNPARAEQARSSPDDGQPWLNRQGIRVRGIHLALLGAMLLAAFFRLHKIDLIPLEMGCDLPHNYNNIRLILRGEYLIFFPSHPGREGLFFYLAAPLARAVGLNHTTIKIASALVGVFTLPALYLLGKELYNRWVGLLAAFLLGISHWHIILTRVGYRASTVPLVLSLMWYFLIRGYKTHRRWFFALAGLFLGLGMYTYNAFMIVPLLVAIMLLTPLVSGQRRALLFHWQDILLLVVVAVYVFIPLGRYAYEQPQMYGYRAATRITDLEATLPQNVWATLLETTQKALLMFNVRGDGVFIANVPFVRELGFVTAIFFILGLAYVLWNWRDGYNLTVLAAFGVMLLPTILSLAFPQEVPNAIRAIGVLPAVMLFPALALALVGRRLLAFYRAQAARKWCVSLAVNGEHRLCVGWDARRARLMAVGAVLVLALVLEARAVYPFYFERYVAHLPYKNYSITLEMARAIDDFADDGESYIKSVPYWYDGNAVRAQLQRTDQSWHNELEVLIPGEEPLAGEPGKFMVIVHPEDIEALQILREMFPQGMERAHYDFEQQVAFITFYGER